MEQKEQVWFDFEGNDDCENFCLGWSPDSGNRCDCGNRRVSFECLENKCKCSDEQMKNCSNAYAAAY